VLFIGFGGFAGSIARYGISILFHKKSVEGFPWQTMIANILGCLLLGLIYGYFEKESIQNQQLKLFLTVGFCGGFTTFSAFTFEGMMMLRNSHFLQFFIYTMSSFALCLIALYLGYSLFAK
jgi:fluoride exporter